MKEAMVSALKALIRGLLIIIPVYLAVLLLLKGMQSVAKLVGPLTHLLPAWPAEGLMAGIGLQGNKITKINPK